VTGGVLSFRQRAPGVLRMLRRPLGQASFCFAVPTALNVRCSFTSRCHAWPGSCIHATGRAVVRWRARSSYLTWRYNMV
jgi:hypothetical protein